LIAWRKEGFLEKKASTLFVMRRDMKSCVDDVPCGSFKNLHGWSCEPAGEKELLERDVAYKISIELVGVDSYAP